MPSAVDSPRTLYDKVWQDHLIDEQDDGTCLIYIDRHLVHEVTSPQAFEGLRSAGRGVRRIDNTLATVDHNIPTTDRSDFQTVETFVEQPDSKLQVMTLEQNIKDFGLVYFGLGDKRQGIVHVIGPEQGFTLPGNTVVCGDSHTSTHGAFGALAFGIGTSEVEHVLATQTLVSRKSKNMLVRVDGELVNGCTSKDVILHIIGVIGTAGGTGCVIEFAGSVIENLSMEARMSMCNMTIEGGARAGMIAPDETTFEYIRGRPLAPKPDSPVWARAISYWKSLRSDPGAKYDIEVIIDGADIVPTVTWGTSPQDVVPITGKVPDPADIHDTSRKAAVEQSLKYMGLTPNTPMEEVKIDVVFIGSCTNSRIEDLRSAAKIVAGRKVAPTVNRAMVVPGSGLVRKMAEEEGLDQIFKQAGFDWREAGCSMCLGMNPDILAPGERCASTSNRNFEGRQGAGGRTHLMSPAMAAAAAIAGKLADVRKYTQGREDILPGKTISVDDQPIPREQEVGADYSTNEEINDEPESTEDVNRSSDPSKTSASSTAASGPSKFTTVTGIAAPLDMENVDTDKIIPKQFLKTIKRTGLGTALFNNIRYINGNAEEGEEPGFVLNQEPFRQAKILVVSGPNFGCGSSREHAPWSLLDFGIKVVIAPSYADIFFNNTFKNGMLPIVLPRETIVDKLEPVAKAGKPLSVDLEACEIRDDQGNVLTTFEVESFRRHCLLNGLDDIGLTLQKEDKIAAFEKVRSAEWPWLDGPGYQPGGTRIKPARPAKKQKLDW